MHEYSEDQSSRMLDANINKSLGLEDDGNSTIYHVPSFLLKTFEIVDVSPTITLDINLILFRIKNTIPLFHGLPTENHSLSKSRMNSQKLFSQDSSNTITSHLS